MRSRTGIAAAAFLCLISGAMAQTITRATISEDGRARVTFENGVEQTIPPEKKQVRVDEIAIADGGSVVGWTILVKNCCTSYPIPMSIVAYRTGAKTVI